VNGTVTGTGTVTVTGTGGDVIEALRRDRILPVVVIDDPAAATDLAAALATGGLRFAEVTFRTPGAAEALAAMAAHPDLIVGAGTVLSTRHVDIAVGSGARFVVSPGFDSAVVEYCQSLDLPVFPGVASATDIQAALRHGLETVKFFPAEAIGGLPLITALAGPFPGVSFIPTGGIDAGNAAAYLRHPAVAAVGGSWMVPRARIEAGDWDSVAALAARARALADDLERNR
jgi:2-dehydro-3-deoxyphosphogluconate aldolase / (4S)-4-hydroxy-2-oxoglutarate aldolase